MSAQTFSNLVVNPLLVWMCAASVALVGYLLSLEIRDYRKHRRMEEQRRRLGLRHA